MDGKYAIDFRSTGWRSVTSIDALSLSIVLATLFTTLPPFYAIDQVFAHSVVKPCFFVQSSQKEPNKDVKTINKRWNHVIIYPSRNPYE